MKILVLGGTAFLGRTFVEAAVGRGHEVTLFNRGKRNPGLFPEHETIIGDRTQDLSPLRGRTWDAVFDTSGYMPRVVQMSAGALRQCVGAYLFISSISVLKEFATPNQDEEAEVGILADASIEEITGETYGPLKALCENVVHGAFGDRAIVVRPGLIVGPNDTTDRFTYWPVRMHRGGEVLVPDIKAQPVQIIDVRDLAEWCLRVLEAPDPGVYNATAPEQPYTFEGVMRACAEGQDARLMWASTEFLSQQEVQPWSDLPLALKYDGSWNGMCAVDVSRAVATGLTFRPLAETISDTREWAFSRPTDYKWLAGLTAEREAELLRAHRRP